MSEEAGLKLRQKKAMPVSPGRPKGVPNKATALLKDAILHAAEQTGEDNKGKDGLTGYLRRVAQEDMKAFTGLLGKVLPMQIAGDPDNPLRSNVTITIVDPR